MKKPIRKLSRLERFIQKQVARLDRLTAFDRVQIGTFIAMFAVWVFWISIS